MQQIRPWGVWFDFPLQNHGVKFQDFILDLFQFSLCYVPPKKIPARIDIMKSCCAAFKRWRVETEQPCQFHSIAKSNDVEKHAGLCVAVDAVDGCHGCPDTLLRGADDNWDDIILLRHTSCRNLCCSTLLVIWQQSGWSFRIKSAVIYCWLCAEFIFLFSTSLTVIYFLWFFNRMRHDPHKPGHFCCNSALLRRAGVTTGQVSDDVRLTFMCFNFLFRV